MVLPLAVPMAVSMSICQMKSLYVAILPSNQNTKNGQSLHSSSISILFKTFFMTGPLWTSRLILNSANWPVSEDLLPSYVRLWLQTVVSGSTNPQYLALTHVQALCNDWSRPCHHLHLPQSVSIFVIMVPVYCWPPWKRTKCQALASMLFRTISFKPFCSDCYIIEPWTLKWSKQVRTRM